MVEASIVEKIFIALEQEPLGLVPKEVHVKLMLLWRPMVFHSWLQKKQTLKTIQRLLRTNTAFVKLPNDKYTINPDGFFSINPRLRRTIVKPKPCRPKNFEDVYNYLKEADGPVDIAELVDWSYLPRLKLLCWLANNPDVTRVSSNLYQIYA